MRSTEELRAHLAAHPSPFPEPSEDAIAACTCEVVTVPQPENPLLGVGGCERCRSCRPLVFSPVQLPCGVRLARAIAG